MRARQDILQDGAKVELLQLEVLLDIRELLRKEDDKKISKENMPSVRGRSKG